MGLPYGTAIDMWSLGLFLFWILFIIKGEFYVTALGFTNYVETGCILAELATGFPLFPGENEVEQLACLMEILGPPPEKILANAPRKRIFFGQFAPPCPVSIE